MGTAPGCGEHACREAGSLKQSLGSHLGNQVQKFLSARLIAGDFYQLPVVHSFSPDNRDVGGSLWMAIRRSTYIRYSVGNRHAV